MDRKKDAKLQAERQRKKYEERKREGICVKCGREKKAYPGNVCCLDCIKKQKEYGINKYWTKEAPLNNPYRWRFAELKEEGKCVKCGQVKTEDGHILCSACLNKMLEKEKQVKIKQETDIKNELGEPVRVKATPKRKRTGKSLQQVVREALAAGMTYGKYVDAMERREDHGN